MSTATLTTFSGWYRRTPMGGWLITCLGILVLAAAAYYIWFAVQRGAVPSNSPYVWAQFATYWAGITIPVLVAVAVAATISQRRRDADAAALDSLLREIKRQLQDALPPAPSTQQVIDLALERAELITDRATLAIMSWPREFPEWARYLLVLRLEGFLTEIGGRRVPPCPPRYWMYSNSGMFPWDSRIRKILGVAP